MSVNLERVICDICPREKADIVKAVAAELPNVFKHFGIDTPLRQAHFLAQAAHETDGFRTLTEYASGDAYDTRTDLGNTAAKDGDGRLHKGRGIFQTTGKTNYQRVRDALRKIFGLDAPDCVKDPTLLAQPKWAAWSAGIYWNDKNLNTLADKDDGRGITKKINGGYNGLNDRLQYLQRAKEALTTGVYTPEPMSRDTIRTVQQKLLDLGYVMVGKPDGIVGTMTVSAISAFRFDNGLPASEKIDDELLQALVTAGPRPIPEARAKGEPKDSTILSTARKLKNGAIGLAGIAGTALAADPLTTLQGVSQYTTTIRETLQKMGLAELPYWSISTVAVAAVLYFASKKIEAARVADHQTGKTA